jgi:hypothetical protein
MELQWHWSRFAAVVGIYLFVFAALDLLSDGGRFWRELIERLLPAGTLAAASVLLALGTLVILIAAVAARVAWRLAHRPPNTLRASLTALLFVLTILSMMIAARVGAHYLVNTIQATSGEAV